MEPQPAEITQLFMEQALKRDGHMSSLINNCDFGVVIVTYNSENVIVDCLESLQRSYSQDLKIIIVDNASTDNTLDVVENYACGRSGILDIRDSDQPEIVALEDAPLVLVQSSVNLGFAAGVNIGLRLLLRLPQINLFWILNPDCRVRADTARNFVRHAAQVPMFGLMGGRILYIDPKDTIQADGGRLNRWAGICVSINMACPDGATPHPDEAKFDYIPGANIVASRDFLEKIGLMPENYFLFYEEVDWALNRGMFKLTYAPGAVVLHHGGASTGSHVLGKRQGSSFSNYFNYRNRIWFMRKYFPKRIISVYTYSLLKIIKLVLQGFFIEANGAFRGLHNLPPPRDVRFRLTDAAARFAFRK